MAAIDQYIERIPNTELQEQIREEVARLTKKKRFGLVYENHLPDNVLMPEVTIRRGTKVALRGNTPNDVYEVQDIEKDNAVCRNLASLEDKTFLLDDLVAVAQRGDVIYPYLKPMESVENAPDIDLWHTLIEADNYHALQTLAYLYPGMVDCIYIDPPYNKPDSHDWKYNCDYVDGTDAYRHSKWLSMMEARLKIAKKLLNPNDSVLIVTIDELEYHHLGCLLEQMFPEARIQMITSVISAKGVVRTGQFSRVEEYVYIVELGDSNLTQFELNMLDAEIKKESNRGIEWLGFRRRAPQAKRESRPNQFYPIFVDKSRGIIHSIGGVVERGVDRNTIPVPNGCIAIWVRVRFLYKLHADALLIHLHRQAFCIVALVYLADFLIARILHAVYLVRTQKLHKQSVQILCSRSNYYLVRVHIHTAKRRQMACYRFTKLPHSATRRHRQKLLLPKRNRLSHELCPYGKWKVTRVCPV